MSLLFVTHENPSKCETSSALKVIRVGEEDGVCVRKRSIQFGLRISGTLKVKVLF